MNIKTPTGDHTDILKEALVYNYVGDEDVRVGPLINKHLFDQCNDIFTIRFCFFAVYIVFI